MSSWLWTLRQPQKREEGEEMGRLGLCHMESEPDRSGCGDPEDTNSIDWLLVVINPPSLPRPRREED